MTPADRQAFSEVILGFAELKGRSLSAPALELYWRTMRDWPLDEFRAAAETLLRTCPWMPTPKDFEDLRRAGAPTAGEAWGRVLAHVRTGSYRHGTGLDDEGPIDRAVAALGGYRAIGMHAQDTTHFLERRFAEHYAEALSAGEVRQALPQVTGSRPAAVTRQSARPIGAVLESRFGARPQIPTSDGDKP